MQEVIQKIHPKSPFVFKEDKGFFLSSFLCKPKVLTCLPFRSKDKQWALLGTLCGVDSTVYHGYLLGSWEVS